MKNQHFGYKFYSFTHEAWDAMYQALLEAKHSIHWEIYAFVDGGIGQKFVDALVEKALRGVEVKLVIDALGSHDFSMDSERRIIAAGGDVLRFNRLYPEWKIGHWISRLLYRNHRKVLIIDEQVALLGGVNLRDEYRDWHDVYLKITGRGVVWPLLRGFAKSYVSAGGEPKRVRRLLYPRLAELRDEGRDLKKNLEFIMQSPAESRASQARRLFLRALAMAKESVNLLSPYYVPDKTFLKAVALARQRGVKVNIFLPLRTDHKIMQMISDAYYELTLAAGAEFFFLPTMNHGKALSVDDTWGAVGSMNLTPRSFYYNEESGVSFHDERMVRELNELFNDWKKTAQAFDRAEWKKRGWWPKMREWWAKRLEDYV